VFVKLGCRLIDGMNDRNSNPNVFADCQYLKERGTNEGASQTLALKLNVQCEAPNEHGGYGIVAAKVLVSISATGLSLCEAKATQREIADNAAKLSNVGRANEHVGRSGVMSFISRQRVLEVGVEVRVAT
jgi:hypothetical protein